VQGNDYYYLGDPAAPSTNDGEMKVYYGAADQVMCLATASVDDLIALCLKSMGG